MLSATINLDLEVNVTGNILRVEPDVGITGDSTEDHDIASLNIKRRRIVWERNEETGAPEKHTHTFSCNLLKGLDKDAKQILISNLLSFLEDDLDEALLSQ